MRHAILHFDILPSTSDYLKNNYQDYFDGIVVVAKEQTAGHGRKGRRWLDNGKSLLFSFLLKDKGIEKFQSLIPLIAGASLAETLLKMGIKMEIKWPNDIYIGDKKVAGIISESIQDNAFEALVIGIGINLDNDDFPSYLPNPTSLYLETNKHFDKDDILRNFLDVFDQLLAKQLNGENAFFPIIKEHDYLKGKKIVLNYYNENRHVEALGIASDGAYEVRNEDGTITKVTSGEVNIDKSSLLKE